MSMTSPAEAEERVVMAPEPVLDELPLDEPDPGYLESEERLSDDNRTGVRSQLTSLASTVHTRINRSGWQEKLRSLSSR